jgi:hypothetical protein
MLSTATGPRWSPGRCSWDIDRPISIAARGGFAGRVLEESDLRGWPQLASVVANGPTSGNRCQVTLTPGMSVRVVDPLCWGRPEPSDRGSRCRSTLQVRSVA